MKKNLTANTLTRLERFKFETRPPASYLRYWICNEVEATGSRVDRILKTIVKPEFFARHRTRTFQNCQTVRLYVLCSRYLREFRYFLRSKNSVAYFFYLEPVINRGSSPETLVFLIMTCIVLHYQN